MKNINPVIGFRTRLYGKRDKTNFKNRIALSKTVSHLGRMTKSNQVAYFTTTKCIDWKPILEKDLFKEVITNSLKFLVEDKRVTVYGFVVMVNHFHLLWRFLNGHTRETVQRDFLKFTAQQILKKLRNDDPALFMELWVEARDRKHQVWARNSLSVPIWSPYVWRQKLGYIHANPVRAGLCLSGDAYKYSSCWSYKNHVSNWDFLTLLPDGTSVSR